MNKILKWLFYTKKGNNEYHNEIPIEHDEDKCDIKKQRSLVRGYLKNRRLGNCGFDSEDHFNTCLGKRKESHEGLLDGHTTPNSKEDSDDLSSEEYANLIQRFKKRLEGSHPFISGVIG